VSLERVYQGVGLTSTAQGKPQVRVLTCVDRAVNTVGRDNLELKLRESMLAPKMPPITAGCVPRCPRPYPRCSREHHGLHLYTVRLD
jgi:hypothetical protein